MSTFEGGQRVPCIMWAPGRIPANSVCESLASTIDLLPTIAALTGTPLPANRPIDGLDISGLLTGTVKSVRNDFLYYSRDGTLEGLRDGDWKFLEPRPAAANKAKAAPKPEVMLFNLASDLGETRNLAAEKPELVESLRRRMVELDAAIGAGARPVWKKSGS
jgi:arylsulfatase A-like enzyme